MKQRGKTKHEELCELGRRLETVASVVYGEDARVTIQSPRGNTALQIEVGEPIRAMTIREAERIVANPATFQHIDKVRSVAGFKNLPIVTALRHRPILFDWLNPQEIEQKLREAHQFHRNCLLVNIVGDRQHHHGEFERYDPAIHLPNVCIDTPWGHSQGITILAEGFYSVSTPGHGGLMLSTGFADTFLSSHCRQQSYRYAGFHCYEEDCAWTLAAWELHEYWVELFRYCSVANPKEYLRSVIEKYDPNYPLE